LKRGDDTTSGDIKISKGEESVFIWSVFYALLVQVIDILKVVEPIDRETNQFDHLEYVFIDDPVSSLDENHLIELAVNLAALIKESDFTKGEGLKFVITTHNPLFYKVLYSELGASRGYILRRFEDGSFELDEKIGDSNKSFSYHLYLKQTLEQAIASNQIEKYHFTLLRNLYEKTAGFLGYKHWSDLLPNEGKEGYLRRIVNFSSHRTLSNEEVAELTEPEKQIVQNLLKNLIEKSGYWKPQEESDG
jgi:wobble nucleotide-excising tRNase